MSHMMIPAIILFGTLKFIYYLKLIYKKKDYTNINTLYIIIFILYLIILIEEVLYSHKKNVNIIESPVTIEPKNTNKLIIFTFLISKLLSDPTEKTLVSHVQVLCTALT